MSSLAPTLEAFFTDRLLCQRRVSPNTIASYRDTFRLLLAFAQQKTGTPPARLEISHLDAPLISPWWKLDMLAGDRRRPARSSSVTDSMTSSSGRSNPTIVPRPTAPSDTGRAHPGGG